MLLDFGADCERVSSQFGLKADEHADAVGMVECARAIRAREEGVRDAIAKARRAVEELCNALESTNTLESEVVSNAVASGANGTAEELALSRLEKAIDAVAEAHARAVSTEAASGHDGSAPSLMAPLPSPSPAFAAVQTFTSDSGLMVRAIKRRDELRAKQSQSAAEVAERVLRAACKAACDETGGVPVTTRLADLRQAINACVSAVDPNATSTAAVLKEARRLRDQLAEESRKVAKKEQHEAKAAQKRREELERAEAEREAEAMEQVQRKAREEAREAQARAESAAAAEAQAKAAAEKAAADRAAAEKAANEKALAEKAEANDKTDAEAKAKSRVVAERRERERRERDATETTSKAKVEVGRKGTKSQLRHWIEATEKAEKTEAEQAAAEKAAAEKAAAEKAAAEKAAAEEATAEKAAREVEAEALLAEELADKAKLSARKKKKKKGSEQVRLEIITDESEAAECEVADDSKGDAAASDAAATSHPEASNAALREAIASGDCDTLTAALAEHRAHGSDSLVAEATSIRNRLRERKKKESQRQRRAHASAMTAHAELQSAQLRGDADALREAVDSADAYTDALPGLEAEVNSARARLEQLALQEAVSPVLVESAALPAAASSVAVVLTFGELESATDCFAPERLIGKGGFGLVYRADAIASLAAERRPPTLRATGLAVKRASTVLELRDFEAEVAILQSCAHAHLLPLLGVCEEPACLVFPLMVGGSLQARLDLDPRDVAYLQAMGHFVQAPPKPLTWRQRLRAVMQATEALVYLHKPHERKPRTLHRDFKPANILLDHDLHAYLGDTGFAKAARQSGEFSRRSDTTTGRIMCSPGYADIDVLNGEYSELTDGFAVGVTLLVVLTRRDPVRIVDVIEEEHDAEMDDIPAEQLAEPSANWPSEVARALKELHKGLCLLRARRRLRLPDALQTLSALLEAHPTSSQMHQQPEATAASSVTTGDSDASASTTYEASPLSLQVRRMRAEDGPELSVQRNVTDAFSTCMRRLATLYKDAEAQTPEEFDERINYWHEACGLPEEVHTRLHTLRRWRNMSEHHLDQPERWASKGPSAKVASEHIAELQVRIDALTFGAARVSDRHRAHAAECAPSLSLPGKGGNTKPNTR